jgi:hypothetical protein
VGDIDNSKPALGVLFSVVFLPIKCLNALIGSFHLYHDLDNALRTEEGNITYLVYRHMRVARLEESVTILLTGFYKKALPPASLHAVTCLQSIGPQS